MLNVPAFNLDAELSADAEVEKNAARGAIPLDAKPLKVDVHANRIPKEKRRAYQKVVAMAKRAIKLSHASQHTEAAQLAAKAVELAPELALTNHVMGLMLYQLGRLSRSLDFFEAAWKIDPNDAEIYQKLGLVAWKLDMLEAAEKFYRIECKLAPDNPYAVVNLAGVLRDQGKYEEAIEMLRVAIYAHQDNHELWNSMGTVLTDAGRPDEASTFFEEALRLQPDSSRAHNNMANVYELLGEPEKSLPHYDEALKNPVDATEEATMRHGRSFVLLACNRLAEGWEANAHRLDPDRAEATLFAIDPPMWDGVDPEQIRGKTLVVVGEQGLGDEVLFMSTIKDLQEAIGPEGELRIACEYRLMPLVKRSFPDAVVGHHMSAKVEGREIRAVPKIGDGADLWTPMATPLRAFRNSIEDFPKEAGFLKADPDMQARFREQLEGMGNGLKVGILWKSLKMDAGRARFFSAFDAWEGVLKVPGVDFVNLQYGEVDAEIALASERFGMTIHQPRDIDLKMELDKVAALASAVDVVIGPMNATSNLAAACGGEVWFIHARPSAWTLLGTGRQHWYPQTRSFVGERFQDWENTMLKVETALKDKVKARS